MTVGSSIFATHRQFVISDTMSFRPDLRLFFTAAAIFLSAGMALAQKYTISGYVTESGSGEPLIGVAVINSGSSLGTVTSNSGYYSISLEKGEHTLEFACIGYTPRSITVNLIADIRNNVQMEESNDMLEGAVVTTHYDNTGVRGTQMSAIEVPLTQIKAIPAIGGEVDVIKALQLLPGVQSGTEGTAGIYVRGGGADENLLLMDGVPLYNVNHLFGFFSVFNADALKNVTLYKGSFPARFGGHLSSVIDVRMNDGNENGIHGSASIGLISSKFNLEGPIVKGRTTFNLSARRTYMDLLAKPVLWYANRRNGNSKDDFERYGGGYDFYDLNAKITHRLNNGDRISLCIYSGDDNAHIRMTERYKYNETTYSPELEEFVKTGYVIDSREKMKFGWRWGNFVTSLRWNHELSPRLYMSTSASYTQYRSLLSVGMEESEKRILDGRTENESSADMGVDYNSLINDVAANADFEWHPDLRHDVKFGGGYTYHSFKPGIISLYQSYKGEETEGLDFSKEVGDTPLFSHEAAIYGEDNWAATPWLKVNLGARAALYSVSGKTYLSAEPRLSARALVSNEFSIKASYSEMSQFIHMLSNSNISMPSDLWVPVTSRIRPMRSRQAAVGAFYELGQFSFSAEGYYKTMSNVLEYKDGASYLGTSTGWEDKVSMGRGWSYGLELMAQKTVGRTTGWIGYTISKSMRKFDQPGNVINDGNPFPAKYDRRHDLSATVTHTFSKRFDLSATFVYTSGNCGTLGYDEYPLENLYPGEEGNGFEYSYMTGTYIPNRNNYRMPSYNRLDLGMNFYKQKKRGTRIWNLSVYNVYNRLNPFMIVQGSRGEEDPVTGQWHSIPVLKKMSIFPIMPSLSYTYKF